MKKTDTPDRPPSYGAAGWTKDGKSVLLYDHYDIWAVSPDGSGAKNITAGYGRAHDLHFRYVRTITIRASAGSTPPSRCCCMPRISRR